MTTRTQTQRINPALHGWCWMKAIARVMRQRLMMKWMFYMASKR